MVLKGKRAWRKTLDTGPVSGGCTTPYRLRLDKACLDWCTVQLVERLGDQARELQQGLVLEHVPDQELFFEDKAGVGVDRALDKAQRASKKPRLLKSQAIIAEAHAMKPAMPYHLIKQKSSRKQPSRKSSTASNAPSAASSRGIYDIWDQPVQHTSNGQLHVADSLTLDRHDSGQLEATKKGQRSRGKHVKAAPPGTSFNPDPEQHQAALATAVAHEVGKGLERELGVKAPGQIAPAIALAASSPTDGMDELAMLQTIAESDEEDPHAIQLNGEDSNAEDAEVDEATGRQSRAQPGRKLQPSSVKLEARKAAQDEQAARVALKQQRRDIENLSGLAESLDATEEGRRRKRVRLAANRAEKAASQPARLSRHVFQPEPEQVLTSDEVTGSLRQIRPAVALARDRFKALQHSGMVEPRIAVQPKKGRKVSLRCRGVGPDDENPKPPALGPSAKRKARRARNAAAAMPDWIGVETGAV